MHAEVLHPYIGFVISPTKNDIFGFGNEISPIQKRDSRHYIVAITGGSVACQLHQFGWETLREELRKIPELSKKEIIFIKMGAGGFKQPQQLMALNYLISLGGEFDLVINIDGFNEAALPEPENIPKQVFPIYPRNWFARIGSYSVPLIRYAMETNYLCQKLRMCIASFFSLPVINNSSTFNFFWEFSDLVFLSFINRTQAFCLNHKVNNSDYEVSGPPLKFGANGAGLYQYIAMHWAKSSLLMSQICEANKIRYFHFLQPNQYFVDSKRLTKQERTKAFLEDHPYRKGVVLGYPAMQMAAKSTLDQTNFHDLTMIYAREDQTIYADTCCHYNSEGYEILAREIGRIIQQSFSQRKQSS